MTNIVTNKDGIEFDIDKIATDLNGKADVDLINLNSTGKIAIAHNAMPSALWSAISMGASHTEYLIPYDGYLSLGMTSNVAPAYVSVDILVDNQGSPVWWTFVGVNMMTANQYAPLYIPVAKGTSIRIRYEGVTFHNYAIFYLKGSESEAS